MTSQHKRIRMSKWGGSFDGSIGGIASRWSNSSRTPDSNRILSFSHPPEPGSWEVKSVKQKMNRKMWTLSLCWSRNDWCPRRNLLVELGWEKARGILTDSTAEGRQTKLCSYLLPLPQRCQEQYSSEEWKRKDSWKNPRPMTSVLQRSQASVPCFLVNTPLAQDPVPPTSKHVFQAMVLKQVLGLRGHIPGV